MLNKSEYIFREYDIRGVYGDDLTDDIANKIAKAYATMLKRQGLSKISLARDGRLSSENLFNAFMDGVVSTGCDVVDIGICPTPLLYFSLFTTDVDGGVMITGSHNPPEFNGFKLCIGKETIYQEKIQKLKEMIVKNDFVNGHGKISKYDIIPKYINFLKEQFSSKIKNKKIVIDSGNGTCGVVVPEILKELNCYVIDLNSEIDGKFPNHHPDPTIPENLKQLITEVKKNNAEVGVAYDGDGDRIGVIDENGNIVWPDLLLLIFAKELIKNYKDKYIITEVKASQILLDEIKKIGGKILMWKTGHSLIKAKMKEINALVAGEMSGHIFFADRYFGFDDAIYTTCRLLEVLSYNTKPLSKFFEGIPKYYSTPEIRIDCPDSIKFNVVEEFKKKIKQQAVELITIDGVRAVFRNGWALVRASNTQPVLVLRFESKTQEDLNILKANVLKILNTTFDKIKFNKEANYEWINRSNRK